MLIKRTLTLVAGAGLALALAACGSNTTPAAGPTSAASSMAPSSSTAAPSMSSSMAPSISGSDMGAALVGSGGADYARQVPTGAGSVDGMAQDPVATAAANNPLLTTLVAAVSGKVNPQVDLVNTLNSGEFTVFAPVDSAFAKIDAGTMDTLKTNSELLSGILTYHVVAGQLDPSQVVGTHPTVNGASVTVTGSGDTLKVNNAGVICGGVKTKNATVYLIDTVLMPPAG